MNDQIIARDDALAPRHHQRLAAALDVIIPASADGRLPSGRDMPLVAHINRQEPDFLPVLEEALDGLDEDFAGAPFATRHGALQAISQTQAELFQKLLFHAVACYYSQNQVRRAIGLVAGAPFPRGNDVAAGDLSLLDPVMARAPMYRQ